MTPNSAPSPFAAPSSHHEVEEGTILMPRFNADGLVSCIVTDSTTGDVVMFAHMNAEALRLSIETRIAHYWSRSRQKLWRKGETSGHEQDIVEMRVDCDQDAIWIKVSTRGTGASCHTGRFSCFYRSVPLGKPVSEHQPLECVDTHIRFDPAAVYKK